MPPHTISGGILCIDFHDKSGIPRIGHLATVSRTAVLLLVRKRLSTFNWRSIRDTALTIKCAKIPRDQEKKRPRGQEAKRPAMLIANIPIDALHNNPSPSHQQPAFHFPLIRPSLLQQFENRRRRNPNLLLYQHRPVL